jgi:hypothetical protein
VKYILFISVVDQDQDTDPYWIRIAFGWLDLNPGGQKEDTQIGKK